VQIEIERRKNLGRPVSCNSPFSAKIVCGECGGFYGSKVWNSTDKYRKVIWRCNEKYKGDKPCWTPHINEEAVKQKFLEAFNKLTANRDELIENCRMVQKALCDCTEAEKQLDKLYKEIEVVAEFAKQEIRQSVSRETANSGERYQQKYEDMTKRIGELELSIKEKQAKYKTMEMFIKDIEDRTLVLTEFDEKLWTAVVDRVIVSKDGEMVFKFKDGTEIEA
jgi:site-specific DNA recombinase